MGLLALVCVFGLVAGYGYGYGYGGYESRDGLGGGGSEYFIMLCYQWVEFKGFCYRPVRRLLKNLM